MNLEATALLDRAAADYASNSCALSVDVAFEACRLGITIEDIEDHAAGLGMIH